MGRRYHPILMSREALIKARSAFNQQCSLKIIIMEGK